MFCIDLTRNHISLLRRSVHQTEPHPGLFTPADTENGGEWSELAGEVKGELLLSGVVETCGRSPGTCESSGAASDFPAIQTTLRYDTSHTSTSTFFTFVVNPFPQTSHLKGRSFVWLLMWISRAELHANTLKQSWQVVLPRAANISSMSGSNAGGKIKLKSTRQTAVPVLAGHVYSRLMPAKGESPNCGRMGGGGAAPAPRPARLGRGKGRPGWRLAGNSGEPPGPSEGKFCR